mgnify:CR=1 FL=1
MSNAVRAFLYIVSFVFSVGCGQRQTEIVDNGSPDPLHLIPFSCRYLGFPIPELDQCWLACNRSVVEEYDLSTFTVDLECKHPDYSALKCGLD